jgi:hypothetical protein
MMDTRHLSVYRGSKVARKLYMTWVCAGRRWIKKHRGKMYAVSCRQLGCPETKEASAAAANAWWEAKEEEIATAPPTELEVRANAFKLWTMVQDWSALDETSRETLVDSPVGAGEYQKIKCQAEAESLLLASFGGMKQREKTIAPRKAIPSAGGRRRSH